MIYGIYNVLMKTAVYSGFHMDGQVTGIFLPRKAQRGYRKTQKDFIVFLRALCVLSAPTVLKIIVLPANSIEILFNTFVFNL